MKQSTKITPIALATTLLVAGGLYTNNAQAHNDDSGINISSEKCDISFDNALRISPSEVIITAQNKVLSIGEDGRIFIDGQEKSMSPEQKRSVLDFADNIRGQVPQVGVVVMQGVALAETVLDEVNQVFNIDNQGKLKEIAGRIGDKLSAGFYQEGSFVMDRQAFDNFGKDFEREFETELEAALEQVLTESIGSLFVAIGQEMMSGDGSMNSFEQKMERFAADMEEKIEAQAQALEHTADNLCLSFVSLAEQEDKVQQLVPELKQFDLFSKN